MTGFAQELTESARRVQVEWGRTSMSWRDHTARSFYDRFWSDLERETGEMASEAAALEEALAEARSKADF